MAACRRATWLSSPYLLRRRQFSGSAGLWASLTHPFCRKGSKGRAKPASVPNPMKTVTFGFSVNLFEVGIKLLSETVGELLIERVLQLLSSINTRIKIIKRINFILTVFNADFHPYSFYAENTYKLYTSLNLF